MNRFLPAVLIGCSASLAHAQPTARHNYIVSQDQLGTTFYTYKATDSTASDLAAGLAGLVAVEYRGCRISDDDTCYAVATLNSSLNKTIIMFKKDDDIIGYAVEGPNRQRLAHAAVHAEEGSVLKQIAQDALGGKLRVGPDR